MSAKDYTGNRYGMLTVLGVAYKKSGHKYYTCKCDCGNTKVISASHLVTGASKSCGCMVRRSTIERNTTHGQSKTRLYTIWTSMKKRCFDPNSHAYHLYGNRGITVCDEWKESFESFRDWSIANGYSDSLSIDRIDVDGNYEPGNCRWTTAIGQARNKRNNRVVTINGVTKFMVDWFEESPVSITTIYQRLRNGWNVEDAILKPDQRKCKRIR